jgi:multidrug resistance efflux pump
MEPLPNIPIPPKLVWREIRHRAFPGVVFVAALIAALVLWKDQANAPHLIGEVESVSSLVTTVEDGSLIELKVDRYQAVEKGQVLGEFRVSDPDSVRLELATISTDLQVLQTRMAQDQQRILQDFEQLRLSWLQERVALATARIELQFAESELNRVAKLFADKLVSDDQHDLAKSTAESRRAEVAERERMVGEIEASLKRLAPDDTGRFNTAINDKISQAIAAQEELLRMASKTVTLRAPITGLVTVVHHQQGERVRRGEAIVTITATVPERIVAYVRQPAIKTPQAGDAVEIRSRASRRQVGLGKVIRVGHHYETISTNVAAATPGLATSGLPVLISLPENLVLLPGEIVDLALRPN